MQSEWWGSFFIPLEQGLKHTGIKAVAAFYTFFLHSIRTRIKTLESNVPLGKVTLFFLHSIRTRIKPQRLSSNFHPWLASSFFIPLEQGLKTKEIWIRSLKSIRFFLHSIRTRIKTKMILQFCNPLTGSFFIPLEQGLKRILIEKAHSLLFVLSSFH